MRTIFVRSAIAALMRSFRGLMPTTLSGERYSKPQNSGELGSRDKSRNSLCSPQRRCPSCARTYVLANQSSLPLHVLSPLDGSSQFSRGQSWEAILFPRYNFITQKQSAIVVNCRIKHLNESIIDKNPKSQIIIGGNKSTPMLIWLRSGDANFRANGGISCSEGFGNCENSASGTQNWILRIWTSYFFFSCCMRLAPAGCGLMTEIWPPQRSRTWSNKPMRQYRVFCKSGFRIATLPNSRGWKGMATHSRLVWPCHYLNTACCPFLSFRS